MPVTLSHARVLLHARGDESGAAAIRAEAISATSTHITIEPERLRAILRTLPVRAAGSVLAPEPSLDAMATSAAYALWRAVAAATHGAQVLVTPETFSVRQETCGLCPHRDPAARFRLGKCRVCGCTRLKLWLATERCPLGKW